MLFRSAAPEAAGRDFPFSSLLAQLLGFSFAFGDLTFPFYLLLLWLLIPYLSSTLSSFSPEPHSNLHKEGKVGVKRPIIQVRKLRLGEVM